MAEVLTEYNFSPKGVAKYPWDTWFDGRIRRLKKGTDFQMTCKSMSQAIYSQAKAKKVKVRLKLEGGDALILKALPDVAEEVP